MTKQHIICWFEKFRYLDTDDLDGCKKLIDIFLNSIYLYDDYFVITFNYKDGTKTVKFDEIADLLGSGLVVSSAPKARELFSCFFIC